MIHVKNVFSGLVGIFLTIGLASCGGSLDNIDDNVIRTSGPTSPIVITVSTNVSDISGVLNHFPQANKNYPYSRMAHYGGFKLLVVTECSSGCSHSMNAWSDSPDIVKVTDIQEMLRLRGKIYYYVTLDTPIDWSNLRAKTGTAKITVTSYDKIGNTTDVSIPFTTFSDPGAPLYQPCINCDPD